MVVGEQLRRPTSRGDHDDGQPERLLPDAGVNRHIDHPVRIGGVRLKRDEPDPASQPVRRRLLLQLLAGELSSGFALLRSVVSIPDLATAAPQKGRYAR